MSALSVEAALERILDSVAPLEAEHVDLIAAAGRVLAADLAARLTQPPFDASAMDGYAVRAADVATLPATLRLIGESAAGHAFTGTVQAGETARIFTGAPLPPGADAIVIQENVEAEGSLIRVVDGQPDVEHVRPRGGDFREGDTPLRAGKRLTARDITLAAAMGHATLPVRRRPRVAILATGDELVTPGETPRPDQIISSNPYGLAAMISAAGGEPKLLGIARDTHESLAEKIALAHDADILLTIGGASVGDHDLVVPALERAGMSLGFWKIAMRPGKPLIFGRRGEQRIIGLPGNPVSSLICTRVFVVPLIAKLLDDGAPASRARTAALSVALPANGPRAHYMRGRLGHGDDGAATVAPVSSQDSSLLTPLAAADCLIVRPPHALALAPGSAVTTLDLDF